MSFIGLRLLFIVAKCLSQRLRPGVRAHERVGRREIVSALVTCKQILWPTA